MGYTAAKGERLAKKQKRRRRPHMTLASDAAAAGDTIATTCGSMWNTKDAMSRGPMPEGVRRMGM